MPSFGENLRQLRLSRGYTQEKFSKVIDSNQSNVTAWERGTRMPNLETIQFIADTFKVPLSSLISVDQTGLDEDYVREIADLLKTRPDIRTLIGIIRYMPERDLATVINVAEAFQSKKANV